MAATVEDCGAAAISGISVRHRQRGLSSNEIGCESTCRRPCEWRPSVDGARSQVLVKGPSPAAVRYRKGSKFDKALMHEFRARPTSMDLAGFAAALGDRSHAGKLQDLLGRGEAIAPRPEGGLQAGSKNRTRRRKTGKQGLVGMLDKQLTDLLLPLLQAADQIPY